MPDLVAPMSPPPAALAARLDHELGIRAGRLHALLARILPSDAAGRENLAYLAQWHAQTTADPNLGVESPDRPHPLDRLRRALELDPLEMDAVILALMPEAHEGFGVVLRSLHPAGRPFPTVGLITQLLTHDGTDRTAAIERLHTGAAIRSGVLRRDGDGPDPERDVRLGEAIHPALLGLDVWPGGVRARPRPGLDAGLETWFWREEVRHAARLLLGPETAVVLFTSDHVGRACERAAALSRELDRPCVEMLAPPDLDAATLQLAGVHAALRGATFVLRRESAVDKMSLELDLDGLPESVVVCAEIGAAGIRTRRPIAWVRCEPLGPGELGRLWNHVLPELSRDAETLAATFPIEPTEAMQAARDARARAGALERAPTFADVASSLRARSDVSVRSGFTIVAPTASWDALVLPPRRLDLLKDVVRRLRHQTVVLDDWRFLNQRPGARGVRVLLSGPPGTGKTLAAEVLAHELGVDLLIIDLSRVLSKWLGETEQRLAAAFDAAERSRALLLFDDAESLFGRRTEISDAHDRYANLESAFLLTRLERFQGLAALSTNMRGAIDPAFLRRIEFHIDFDEPSRDERLAIWRGHVPADAPLADDVCLAELADFYPMVGGLIKNAAAGAAFLGAAASDGRTIRRENFLLAIRREFDKASLPFPGQPPERAHRTYEPIHDAGPNGSMVT